MGFRWVALCFTLLVGAVAASSPEGAAYLEANAKKDGVVTLESGLQYRVLASGDPNGPSPNRTTPCECHYAGRTITGQEFDSSFKRGKPTTFAPNQVIAGWTEAMQLMHEGDKWELTIPSELAYGDRQRGQYITPGSVLVFDLEMLKVLGSPTEELPEIYFSIPTEYDLFMTLVTGFMVIVTVWSCGGMFGFF